MANDAVASKLCESCKIKISSDKAEPHSTCGDCRLHLNGGSCTYKSRCSECKSLDDAAWDKSAALKLRLWKKSVAHLKSKLPRAFIA